VLIMRALSPRSPHLPAVRAVLLSALTLSLLAGDSLHAQDRSWPPQYRRERPQLALVGSATDGTGFEIMGSVGVSVLSLGGGYQRSTHRLGASDATVDGIFFEPRVALPLAARNFTPFVYGRVSRLDRSVNGEIGSLETRGTGLGAGVGTYLWLAPNLQLSTSVGWSVVLGFDRWGR
jgi:hypothetical protein